MAPRRHIRSVAVPVTLAAVAVPVTAALLVAWAVLLGSRVTRSPEAGDVWLLVLGAVAFAGIITILVLFSVFLAREIREVRRQDSFIDSVTHELKSPLASLRLCVETLGRHDLASEQHDTLRAMMMTDIDRLTSFIDDVLQANRLAHDAVTFDFAEVDVASLAHASVSAVTARRGVAEAAVDVDVPAGTTVTTDRAALELVLRNLIDNAVKYSNEPIEVRVVARRNPDGSFALSVSDRGIGIARDELERVFHRFYRGDRAEVRAQRGTGIGLYVVSSLVRNLGGTVHAESEGEGLGATLHVRLPPPERA
jgi:signal transduction histidine kinase